MTQESNTSSTGKDSSNDARQREKRDRNLPPTKVVVRRLPPTMTLEIFSEQVSPLPEHDYIYFVKADLSLSPNAFSRVYVNFVNQEDIFTFKDKFDGYVFVDQHGNEYPAVVEFAPFQKIPKKKSKKKDTKCGSIETDPDYLKFLELLQNPEEVVLPTAESYLEEIEARERELKASNGILRVTTPLIEYIKQKKAEKMRFREEKREERRRREMERKRIRDEERKRRKAEKEKEKASDKSRESDKDDGKKSESEKTKSEPVLKLLRNPEREKDDVKEKSECSASTRDKQSRPLTDWEKERRRRDEERQRQREKQRDRERDRREQRDKERMGRRNDNRQSSGSKYQDWKKDDSTKGFKDGAEADEKDRGKKIDSRGKNLTGYDHQWNKNRRWDDDRYNRRGGGTVKPYERRGDFNRKSQDWKNEKREEVEKEKAKESNLEVKNKSEDEIKNKDETEEKNMKGSTEVMDGSEEILSDDKKCDDGKENGRQDPRKERRIKNKDRPSLELYRPGMRRLQRNSPQKDAQVGSASSSSSPSPTLNLLGKGGNNDED